MKPNYHTKMDSRFHSISWCPFNNESRSLRGARVLVSVLQREEYRNVCVVSRDRRKESVLQIDEATLFMARSCSAF